MGYEIEIKKCFFVSNYNLLNKVVVVLHPEYSIIIYLTLLH